MYLVDTSVWVDYIQGRETPVVQYLDSLLDNPLSYGINDHIYMEILQGAKDQNGFDKLKRYFSGQYFYRFSEPQESHAKAAQLYLSCRQQGITVRSSIDCLIAQTAIEYDLVLLHHDNDYKNMHSVVSDLKQKHFLV